MRYSIKLMDGARSLIKPGRNFESDNDYGWDDGMQIDQSNSRVDMMSQRAESIEVEIRPIASAFTNAPNCTSAAPAASGSTCESTCAQWATVSTSGRRVDETPLMVRTVPGCRSDGGDDDAN